MNGPSNERTPTRWMLAVAAVIVLLTVGSPLFGRGVLHPADVIEQAAPWRADTKPDFRPQNSLLTDVADAATPNRTELHRRFLDGQYALWNPYAAGGSPLGTQPHNGMLSPLQLPYLLLPAWYAPAVAKLLQMLIALGFTFLFLRRIGLGRPAALIGGAIFANSAFLVVWTGFPHSDVAVLIPALFWSVERALGLRTLRAGLPIAVVLASMLLSGFPAVAAYAGIAVAAYTLVRLGVRRASPGRVNMLARLAAIVALGAGLAAVQLLPFIGSLNEFDRSYRGQTTADVEPVRSLATMAIPSAYGRLGTAGYTTMSGVENQTFAGATTLVLVLGAVLPLPAGGLLRRARWYLWSGVALVLVVVFVGGPILSALQKVFPFVFEQNRIGRLDSLLGFFLAALAAIGFQTFITSGRPPLSRGWRRAWGALCGAAAVGAVLTGVFLIDFASDAGQRSFLLRQLWLPAIVAGVTIAALLVGRSTRPGGFHPVLWVAPVAFAVESIVFATGFLPTIDRSDFYPVTSTHRFLAKHIGHERLAAEGSTMWPGTQTYYGLRTVASHAFHPDRWLQLLETAGIRGGYETQPQLSAKEKTATSPILDRLGVRFWVARPDLGPMLSQNEGLRLEHVGGAVVYRRVSALPRIRWATRTSVEANPSARIHLLSQRIEPNTVVLDRAGPVASGEPASLQIVEDSGDAIRVRIRAEGNGYLVVADSIQDGWRATVDARAAPIVPADHAIGAVYVPRGEHVVSLVYRPRSWRNGQIISLASLLILGVLVVATRREGRVTPPADGALGLGERGKV